MCRAPHFLCSLLPEPEPRTLPTLVEARPLAGVPRVTPPGTARLRNDFSSPPPVGVPPPAKIAPFFTHQQRRMYRAVISLSPVPMGGGRGEGPDPITRARPQLVERPFHDIPWYTAHRSDYLDAGRARWGTTRCGKPLPFAGPMHSQSPCASATPSKGATSFQASGSMSATFSTEHLSSRRRFTAFRIDAFRFGAVALPLNHSPDPPRPARPHCV